MKISKLALIALLGGALMAFGCESDNPPPDGTGGSGGGDGGSGGMGGDGGGGGMGVACEENTGDTCTNGTVGAITENCEPATPAPPDVPDACTGSESIMNPASCTATGTVVTHNLTLVEVNADCNAGYDQDGCNGASCAEGSLAQPEGMNGVDNQLAALAETLQGVGGDISNVNQAFYDSICNGDISIQFGVDANLAENCANVAITVGGMAAGSIIVNVSDPDTNGNVCASGTIGDVPVSVGGAMGALNNGVIRMTISAGGFSSGVLGVTIPEALAGEIADQIISGGAAAVSQVLDIQSDLSGDTNATCDSLSMTLTIGGVVELL